MRSLPIVLSLCVATLLAADPPVAEIRNGTMRAKLYLPDAANGYYRGTRFDWSGVVQSLEAEGHTFYGPWFTRRDSTVRDFVYVGEDIVAGPCSSTMGPAEEFRPIGYDAAKPGGTFLKIGVGLLKRPDAAAYDAYRLYEVANSGTWTVRRTGDSITFIQTLRDEASGFGYVYEKSIRLGKGKGEMRMSHRLKNTGKTALETSVYNHNFLVVDGKGPAAGTVIEVPYSIQATRQPDAALAAVTGTRITYQKTLTGKEVVSFPVAGFGAGVADHSIRIESPASGAGVEVRGDRPLQRMNLWSIRSNVSMEPFIAVSVAPGKVFTWANQYRYYRLP